MTLRKPDPILIFMIVIAAFIMLAMFTGCYTEKKAQQQIERADATFPALLPKIARDKYPCTDLLRPDTVIVNGDTVIMIECPEMNGPADYVPRETDTIRIPGTTTTRTVRVPVTLPVQTRYITKWYEDSAKLKLAAFELGKLQVANDKLTKDLAAMTSSRATYRKWFWILIFIAGGLTFWTIRKLFI